MARPFPVYESFSLPKIDRDILAFWDENRIFEESINYRTGSQAFTFYEGPPSANGTPGIHHVMARTIKDIFCRYKTLRGFQVKRKGGWDTHGLPVELQVEKRLGITKDDIGTKITIEEYNQACREDVLRFKDNWDDLTRKMGYWVDLNDPYVTFHNSYIESVWHLLKRLYDKNALYKGYTIQPYSPAAGTGLSSHELNMPGAYRMVKDTTAIAQFKLKSTEHPLSKKLLEMGEGKTYILAWTTTPWTLPSNTALAVGKNIRYAVVKTLNPYTHEAATVVLAEDLMERYFSAQVESINPSEFKPGADKTPYLSLQGVFTGAELEGLEYEQLLPYVQPDRPAFRVIVGDFVSTEDGTGIVHIAPTFGGDDYRVAQQNNIPALLVKDNLGNPSPLVDKQGRFVKEVQDFAGRYVKDYGQVEERPVDVDIVIKLKAENKLFRSQKYEHTYPHCWRTDKPVLYYPLDSWFIRTTQYKDRFIAHNNTINWKPTSTGTGRFGNWLENLVDWNLSRSRFWGIPLPIWATKDYREIKCIGSLKELKQEMKKAVTAGFMNKQEVNAFLKQDDLHKPYVDRIVLVSDSGQPMRRESDVIDVWFDSGAMPFAQWHYPFSNKAKFKKAFPADFISEGIDQTRGWFFTLHAISVMLEDKPAFKNVLSTGLVLDKEGRKMSKRLGNAVNPFDLIGENGADAVRWYMIGNAAPWENLRFDPEGVKEAQRKFLGKLYNTYSFFALYANLDKFTYDKPIPLSARPELDRWILSVLNSLIRDVTAYYDDYEPTKACRAIEYFVIEQLSNWFVRLSRRRFWKEETNENKVAAFQTLFECLQSVSILMSPVAPFYAERLYKDLTGRLSVHLTDFPLPDLKAIDPELERRMDMAQQITSLLLSIRKESKINVRQPLQKALVAVSDTAMVADMEKVRQIISDEVNLKQIEYLTEDNSILVKRLKPNFKKLGPKVGGLMKEIPLAVSALTQADIRTLESEGRIMIELSSQRLELTLDEVEIFSEDIPGWKVASAGKYTVALDLTVNEELKREGLAREFVNRIQNLRKQKGLDVTDRITVRISSHESWNEAIRIHAEYIGRETLANKVEIGEINGQGDEIEVYDIQGKIIVSRTA